MAKVKVDKEKYKRDTQVQKERITRLVPIAKERSRRRIHLRGSLETLKKRADYIENTYLDDPSKFGEYADPWVYIARETLSVPRLLPANQQQFYYVMFRKLLIDKIKEIFPDHLERVRRGINPEHWKTPELYKQYLFFSNPMNITHLNKANTLVNYSDPLVVAKNLGYEGTSKKKKDVKKWVEDKVKPKKPKVKKESPDDEVSIRVKIKYVETGVLPFSKLPATNGGVSKFQPYDPSENKLFWYFWNEEGWTTPFHNYAQEFIEKYEDYIYKTPAEIATEFRGYHFPTAETRDSAGNVVTITCTEEIVKTDIRIFDKKIKKPERAEEMLALVISGAADEPILRRDVREEVQKVIDEYNTDYSACVTCEYSVSDRLVQHTLSTIPNYWSKAAKLKIFNKKGQPIYSTEEPQEDEEGRCYPAFLRNNVFVREGKDPHGIWRKDNSNTIEFWCDLVNRIWKETILRLVLYYRIYKQRKFLESEGNNRRNKCNFHKYAYDYGVYDFGVISYDEDGVSIVPDNDNKCQNKAEYEGCGEMFCIEHRQEGMTPIRPEEQIHWKQFISGEGAYEFIKIVPEAKTVELTDENLDLLPEYIAYENVNIPVKNYDVTEDGACVVQMLAIAQQLRFNMRVCDIDQLVFARLTHPQEDRRTRTMVACVNDQHIYNVTDEITRNEITHQKNNTAVSIHRVASREEKKDEKKIKIVNHKECKVYLSKTGMQSVFGAALIGLDDLDKDIEENKYDIDNPIWYVVKKTNVLVRIFKQFYLNENIGLRFGNKNGEMCWLQYEPGVTIIANDKYKIVAAACEKYGIPFENQSPAVLGRIILEKKFPDALNMFRAEFNAQTVAFFETMVNAAICEQYQETPEIEKGNDDPATNGAKYIVDITKQHSAIIGNPDVEWIKPSAMEKVEKYNGMDNIENDVCYYIEPKIFNEWFDKNGVYISNYVKAGLDRGYIKLEDIKYKCKTKTIKTVMFKEFVDYVYTTFGDDIAKVIVNMFIGLLGSRENKVGGTTYHKSFNGAAVRYFTDNDVRFVHEEESRCGGDSLWLVNNGKVVKNNKNLHIMYNQIVQLSRLQTLEIAYMIGANLFSIVTDCITVYGTRDKPVNFLPVIENPQRGEYHIERNKGIQRTLCDRVINTTKTYVHKDYELKVIDIKNEKDVHEIRQKIGNKNILITGLAGTGKTSLIVNALLPMWESQGKRVLKGAYTHTATLALDGKTLHNIFGRGVDGERTSFVNFNETDVIVIDELSMSPTIFYVDFYYIRKMYPHIQVVALGDFGQNPPVKEEHIDFENSVALKSVFEHTIDLKDLKRVGKDAKEMFDISIKLRAGLEVIESFKQINPCDYLTKIHITYTVRLSKILNDLCMYKFRVEPYKMIDDELCENVKPYRSKVSPDENFDNIINKLIEKKVKVFELKGTKKSKKCDLTVKEMIAIYKVMFPDKEIDKNINQADVFPLVKPNIQLFLDKKISKDELIGEKTVVERKLEGMERLAKYKQPILMYPGLPLRSRVTEGDLISGLSYVVRSFTDDYVIISPDYSRFSVTKEKMEMEAVREIKIHYSKYFLYKLNPGYAMTNHSCQGQNFKEDFTLHEWKHPRYDKRMRYTAVSRTTAIKNVHIADRLMYGDEAVEEEEEQQQEDIGYDFEESLCISN